MSFSCLSLGDSLYQNGSGELDIQLAAGSGLEIVGGEGLALQADQLSPQWQEWADIAWVSGVTGGTFSNARYVQNGKTVHAYFSWSWASGATVTAVPAFDFPVPSRTGSWLSDVIIPGQVSMLNSGSQVWLGHLRGSGTQDRINILMNAANSGIVYGAGSYAYVTASNPFVFATGDRIDVSFWYEAQ